MVSIINARIHILMNFVGPHKQEIICMKCQTLFLRTNKKKKSIHLSSTGYSQRVLMHKFSFRIQRYHFLNCKYKPVTCTLKKQQTALKHLKLRNRSALAVIYWVINHCLEVSCKVDQITSTEREWFIFLQLIDKLWFITQQITHKSWSISILTHRKRRKGNCIL